MKNNKKLFISIEAIMAVMVIAMAFIMLKENSKKDLHKISVIVPNSMITNGQHLNMDLKWQQKTRILKYFL